MYFLFAGLPRFTSQPESSSVYKGNSAILNCEVNVDLAPFVRWEQDRQPVFLDDRVFKLPSGALIISNATDMDGGVYRCIIESGGTPKYSDEAELKILPGINLFFFKKEVKISPLIRKPKPTESKNAYKGNK